MKRPFLEAPDDWLRIPRTSQTRSEYAYAIERYTPAHGWKLPAAISLAITVFTIYLVLI